MEKNRTIRGNIYGLLRTNFFGLRYPLLVRRSQSILLEKPVGNSPNKLSIICPSCDSNIEVDHILREQIRVQVESEFQAELKTERRDLADLRKQLAADKAALKLSLIHI